MVKLEQHQLGAACRVQQENPKIGGAAGRYERYKAARTLQQVLDLGGSRGDIGVDMARGYIQCEDPATHEAILETANAQERAYMEARVLEAQEPARRDSKMKFKTCDGCGKEIPKGLKKCECGQKFGKAKRNRRMTLWSSLSNFYQLVAASTALAKAPDAMFGDIPALVIVVLFGMVSMWLQGLDTRDVKDATRRNAGGTAGVEAVHSRTYRSMYVAKSGGEKYTTYELLAQNEILAGISAPGSGSGSTTYYNRYCKGFGALVTKAALLMLAQRLVLIFGSMAFEEYTNAGCDFGLLVLFNIVYAAFNAKRADEKLTGDSITRRASRVSNRKMKSVDDLAKEGRFANARITFLVKIHGGQIVTYEGLDASQLERDLIGCARHFSAQFDERVFRQMFDERACFGLWYASTFKPQKDKGKQQCGGTLNGFDCALQVNDELFGKDLYRDRCLLEISHAVDRVHRRLAEGRPWTPADEPDDEPTSHGGLRLKLWSNCSESADFATWLFYVVFRPRLEAALALGGKAVFDALTECWEEVKAGPKKYGPVPDPGRYRREIQNRFELEVAPTWRTKLSAPREVKVLVYNARALDAEPRSERVLVARETVSSVPTLPTIVAPRRDGPPTTRVSRDAPIFSTPRPGSTNEADGALSNMSGVSDAIEAIASASSVQSPPLKKSRGRMPNEVDSWGLEPTGSPPASPTGPGKYVPSPEV